MTPLIMWLLLLFVATSYNAVHGLGRGRGGFGGLGSLDGDDGIFHVMYQESEEEKADQNSPWYESIIKMFQSSTVRHDPLHPEYSLPVPEMIRSYGYVCEEHNYTTEDGYVNTLHHIPPSPGVKPRKQAVFLQHGLMGTSADYVMGRPDKSLGYMLADRGYDVWMGNARGNAYSRSHINLTTDTDAYWRFSFDEMGRYDLPAALTYVLSVQSEKNSAKLFYVGHSMGTVMLWVAFNEHAELMREKLEMAVAMGPVAYVDHMVSPIKLLSYFVNDLQFILKLLGIRQLEPTNKVLQFFDEVACDFSTEEEKVCENLVFLLTGYDDKQMNKTLLPIILGHEPGGTSVRTIVHFAQEYKSERFCKYDYGSARENRRFYNGSSKPPSYSLDKVNLPVMLMYSDNDWLADVRDVQRLRLELPDVVDVYEVPDQEFNHIDFLWGLNAPDLVYSKIFKYLDRFLAKKMSF